MLRLLYALAPVPSPAQLPQALDRGMHVSYAATTQAAKDETYRFCFIFDMLPSLPNTRFELATQALLSLLLRLGRATTAFLETKTFPVRKGITTEEPTSSRIPLRIITQGPCANERNSRRQMAETDRENSKEAQPHRRPDPRTEHVFQNKIY